MKTFLRQTAALILALITFASCSTDNGTIIDYSIESSGLFIVCQGNYSSHVDGSMTYIDFASGNASQNVFSNANGVSLGATPMNAARAGSKIYITAYESDVVNVVDATTLKLIKQIKPKAQYGTQPRDILADGGKIYVSMSDGYVARIDTLSLDFDATVKVGSNPEQMAMANGYLYVGNTNGMNYSEGYHSTVSKIDLRNFSMVKTFEVGLNPSKMCSNGKDLFVVCMGDYKDVPSTVKRIDAADNVTEICLGTIAAVTDTKLYVINNVLFGAAPTYTVYSLGNLSVGSKILTEEPFSPITMGVDPITNHIFITSYNVIPETNNWIDFYGNCYVNEYGADGTFIKRYETGVQPEGLLFNQTTKWQITEQ